MLFYTSLLTHTHTSEPRGREALTPHVFALLATEHGGELQLAGYDASAAVGGKVDFVDMSRDTYSVRISGMLVVFLSALDPLLSDQ